MLKIGVQTQNAIHDEDPGRDFARLRPPVPAQVIRFRLQFRFEQSLIPPGHPSPSDVRIVNTPYEPEKAEPVPHFRRRPPRVSYVIDAFSSLIKQHGDRDRQQDRHEDRDVVDNLIVRHRSASSALRSLSAAPGSDPAA